MDHTPAARPLVAIVGGGAAGIFTAWQINRLWPDRFELHLFERSAQPGGNAQSLQVEHDGRRYTLDAGAQFFDRGAQPLYTQALAQLGLGAGITSHATGITLWDSARHERLLWLPAQLDGFKRYTAQDWQRLLKFAAFVVSAALLHAAPAPDWSLSVDDWFAGLPLPENFKRRTLKTFLYQLLSMPPAASGRASALYATDYFLRSIAGGSGADGSEGAPALFRVLQLQDGLAAALERALALSGATLHAAATVAAVSPAPGGVRLVAGGAAFNADLLVFACSPGDCAAMLAAGGQGDAELVPLLRALARDYVPLSIVLGQDTPGWMPADERYWEAVNTLAGTHDAAIAFSVWFGPLRPPGRSGRPVRLFKSWGSPSLSGAPAAGVFFEHQHQVLLPTTDFTTRRTRIAAWQGHQRMHFAGGWTDGFDSQEAALRSASRVAARIGGDAQLDARAAPGPAGRPGQVRAWLSGLHALLPANLRPGAQTLLDRLDPKPPA